MLRNRNRENIDKYEFPESLIRDTFDISASQELSLPDDAAETAEKCIDWLRDIRGTDFAIRERYVKKKTIQEISIAMKKEQSDVKVMLDAGRSALAAYEEFKTLYAKSVSLA